MSLWRHGVGGGGGNRESYIRVVTSRNARCHVNQGHRNLSGSQQVIFCHPIRPSCPFPGPCLVEGLLGRTSSHGDLLASCCSFVTMDVAKCVCHSQLVTKGSDRNSFWTTTGVRVYTSSALLWVGILLACYLVCLLSCFLACLLTYSYQYDFCDDCLDNDSKLWILLPLILCLLWLAL